MKGLVLFDLDGTLVDLCPDRDLDPLRATVLARAAEHGVTPSSRGILATYGQVVRERGFDDPGARAIRADLDEREVRWVREGKSVLLPWADIPSRLPAAQFVRGLVTSNGRACVELLFERGLLQADWFDLSVTRDDCPTLKPSPEPVVLAVGLAGTASVGWFLGDSSADQGAVEAFNQSRPSLELQFTRTPGDPQTILSAILES